MTNQTHLRQPVLFLGHGSPMTTLTDGPDRRNWQQLARNILERAKPRAILSISAHWESEFATLLTGQDGPPTIHDFRGFPQELFDIQYPARGDAGLIQRVTDLLSSAAVSASHEWGLDHGSWGVLHPMFPAADIPVVQMSLNRALSGRQHFELGRALTPLRDEGVLIIGSGNITHNLRQFYHEGRNPPPDFRDAFVDRILDAINDKNIGTLFDFASDDTVAQLAVNSGEHFLPLLYTLGAREEAEAGIAFNFTEVPGLSMVSLFFGDGALSAGMGGDLRLLHSA